MIDRDPIPVIGSVESARWPEHAAFLHGVQVASEALDAVGIPPTDWMIISGGSVALRRLAIGVGDRCATDVDVVILHRDAEHGRCILVDVERCLGEMGERGVTTAQIVDDPRTHYGYTFVNPILEAEVVDGDRGRMPMDFLAAMTTVFPAETPHLPALSGAVYRFPTDKVEVMRAAQPLLVDGRQVQVAHPSFVGFYKATMNRNGLNGNGGIPKQDDLDLLRLHQMGLDVKDPDVLSQLAHQNPDLLEQLIKLIGMKVGITT